MTDREREYRKGPDTGVQQGMGVWRRTESIKEKETEG